MAITVSRSALRAGALAGVMLLTSPLFAHAGDEPVRLAGLFGESDEEKAARLAAQQREQAQDGAIVNLTQRVSDLEKALRDATGQIEEAGHQNALLKEQIAKMQKDFDYRVCQLSAQTLAASPGAAAGPQMDCSGFGGQASTQPAPSNAPAQLSSGSAPPPGRPSGTLGTLPAGTPMPKQDVTVDMAQPSASNPEFQAAMNLLTKGRYPEAGAAFQAFADGHPNDPQAGAALYWVGSVAFVQKDFPGAARAFVEEIKKYPDSELAPQSMLRLGQSLLAMKQTKEGCTTLGALPSRYPKASASLKAEAAKSRHDSGCR